MASPAATGNLKVCLVKGFHFEPGFGEGDLFMAGTFIMAFFKDVIKHTTFGSCNLFTEPTAATVGATDLLCYLLPDANHSIAIKRGAPFTGGSGTTWCPNGRCSSEVYMDTVIGGIGRSRVLANVIIHELLHNKLDADPNQTIMDVHRIGSAIGRDTSKKPLTASDMPSVKDVQAMRQGIGQKIKQYTDRIGGVSIIP